MKHINELLIIIITVCLICSSCVNSELKNTEDETSICTHQWKDADCTNPQTCLLCGETEGEESGHKWDDANCVKPETCSVCGATQGSTSSNTHQWGNEQTLEYATYVSEGTKKLTCIDCEAEKTESIPVKYINFTYTTKDEAEALAKEHDIELEFVNSYDDITTDCQTTESDVVTEQEIDYINKKMILSVAQPAISINKINIDINSVGGVEPEIKIKNNTDKDIAYIYITVKFYDRVGYPAYCDIQKTATKKLRFTGPIKANRSDTGYWDPIIYNYSTAVTKPIDAEIVFTDGTRQVITFTGRYWYTGSFYGGLLHD